MLGPDKRVDYGEQLCAPAGYQLHTAVATTYSLDLEALACVSLALQLGHTLEGRVNAEKLALLESLDMLRDKLLVFHDPGGVHVPPKYSSLYSMLEPFLVAVDPTGAFSAFHPKLWLLRFTARETELADKFRLIVLTRNLTFDVSLDLAVVLDGEATRSRRLVNDPLVTFVRKLPWPAESGMVLNGWCECLPMVKWTAPEPFGDFTFVPGMQDKSPISIKGEIDELLVISPFVDADDDGALQAFGDAASAKTIVSRGDTLDALGNDRTRGRKWECLSIPDTIVDGEEARGEENPARHDLHAKLVVATQGSKAIWHIGSANMTNAALGKKDKPPRNTEFMLRLEGPARTVGPSVLVEAWKKAMLVARHSFSAAPPVAAAVEARLRQLVYRLSTGAWRMTPTATESDLYTVTVETDPPSLPADCEVWVELLCRPSQQPLSRHITWHAVRLSDLSAFVAVHVRFTACKPAMTKTFAVKTQLATRLEEARRSAVFRDIVGTPQRLLNYLTLLVDPGSTKSKWIRGESQGEGAEVFGFDVTNGLYEQLLRAASRAPERVHRAAEVAQRVSTSGVPTPDGLVQLLDVFRDASEGARG